MDIEKELMNENELKSILEKHKKWLAGDPDGERANLRRANLHGANLIGANLHGANLIGANLHGANLIGANLRMADLYRVDLHGANLREANLYETNLRGANLCDTNLCGANLCGADLDFSAWPLWCGSLGVKVDKRIAAQLAYHFCRLDCDDPEYQEAKKTLSKFANQFHRAEECGEVTPHD